MIERRRILKKLNFVRFIILCGLLLVRSITPKIVPTMLREPIFHSFIHSVEIFSLPLYGGPVLITRHAVILNKKHGWEV